MTKRTKKPPMTSQAAHSRYLRRCQLWHNARLACKNEAEFMDSWHAIADAVAAQLKREFPR